MRGSHFMGDGRRYLMIFMLPYRFRVRIRDPGWLGIHVDVVTKKTLITGWLKYFRAVS